jgi:hypothetical protein
VAPPATAAHPTSCSPPQGSFTSVDTSGNTASGDLGSLGGTIGGLTGPTQGDGGGNNTIISSGTSGNGSVTIRAGDGTVVAASSNDTSGMSTVTTSEGTYTYYVNGAFDLQAAASAASSVLLGLGLWHHPFFSRTAVPAGTIMLTDKSGKTSTLATTTTSASGDFINYKVGDVSYALNTKTGQVTMKNAAGAAATGRPGLAAALAAAVLLLLAML